MRNSEERRRTVVNQREIIQHTRSRTASRIRNNMYTLLYRASNVRTCHYRVYLHARYTHGEKEGERERKRQVRGPSAMFARNYSEPKTPESIRRCAKCAALRTIDRDQNIIDTTFITHTRRHYAFSNDPIVIVPSYNL